MVLVSCAVKKISTVMKEGKLFAETASGMVEVVSVNAAEMARLPYDLAEGLYVVGTGSTGAAAGLGICGEGHVTFALYIFDVKIERYNNLPACF